MKVADFGLAKLVAPDTADDADPSTRVASADLAQSTETGVMGTPRYMAPEQRERPADVDHRADIYALGVVLYQMLTGELPDEKQLQPPSRRVRLDVRLDEIVLRALEHEPGRRYASATEFKTRLETVSAPPSAFAAPPARTDAERARDLVNPPAIAMTILGAFKLVGMFAALLLGALMLVAGGFIIGHAPNLSSVRPFGIPVHATLGVVAIFVLGWLALHLTATLYVLVAAGRMRRLRRRRSAVAGAGVLIVLGALGLPFAAASPATLFTIFWSLAELAVGVWALVVLARPEVRAAFSDQTDAPAPAGDAPAAPASPPEAPGAPGVVAPAVGLLVASGMQLLLVGVSLVVLLLFVTYTQVGDTDTLRLSGPGFSVSQSVTPARGIAPFWLKLALPALAGLALAAVLTFVGAWRMRHSRGHTLALTGAALAIVTFQGLGLGVIFGLWALVVLLSRDTHAAFDRGAPRSRFRGLVVATGAVVALLALFALSLAGLWFANQTHRREAHAAFREHARAAPSSPLAPPPTPDVEAGSASLAATLAPGQLDLSPHWTRRFSPGAPDNSQGLRALLGRHEFGGVPFQVGGQVVLAGRNMTQNPDRSALPSEVSLAVGRAFAELHLLHATFWQDPVGVEVATLRFLYADGETRSVPLRYGVHVLDWQRLPGEFVEPLSDPASALVWRGPGTPGQNSSGRVVATTVPNPRPEVPVTRLEFVSSRALASYALVAATLSAADPARPPFAPLPPPDARPAPAGQLRIRVVDTRTGEPLAGVLITPSGTFEGVGTVAQPVLTDAAGVARLPFDPATTADLRFTAARAGYASAERSGSAPIDAECVVRLERAAAVAAAPSAAPPEPLAALDLSALLVLQHEQLAAIIARWTEQNNVPLSGDPSGDRRLAALIKTCAELARRGACPGFIAPLPPVDLPPTASREELRSQRLEPRPWREVPAARLEDALTLTLHLLAQAQLDDAHHGASDYVHVRQAGLAALELFARAGWSPPRPGSAASGQARRLDLLTRIQAASSIANRAARDQALVELASEAARSTDAPDFATSALKQISNPATRDQATRAAALERLRQGDRGTALELARSIGNPAARDQLLAELAQ